MLGFIFKFIGSMIRNQKFRMLIVICGMSMCSFFVMNFFYRSTVLDYSKEELYDRYFHVTYQYSDCDDIEELIDILEQQEGVTQIQLAVFMNDIGENSKAADIPVQTEEYLNEHKEIILVAYGLDKKYDEDNIYIGRGITSEDTGNVMVTNSSYSNDITIGEEIRSIKLWGKEYEICGKYNYMGYDFILTVNDLLELCEEKEGQIQLKYWYDTAFSYKDIVKLENELEKVKEPFNCIREKVRMPVNWDVAFEVGKIIAIAMVISVLNFMFIYQFLLRNRIQQYRVLKLLGVTSNKLQLLMFLEMVITYTVSFFVAYILLRLYLWQQNLFVYNMGNIWIYSYVSLFMLVAVMFFIFTRSFARKSPFATYQEI